MLVGTYNVLNLDPNDGDGDEDVANGRFEATAKIIVENMGAPDIVALQEIQDNDGSDTGVVPADETLQKLVDEIAKIEGAPKYEYVDNIFIGNNTSGGQPDGNIRTAYLYNPWRVSFFEDTLTTIGGQGDGEAFENSRLPLVATFKFLPLQYKFDMVNVHFSSKGGSAAIMGVQQPFEDLQESADVNGGLDERLVQSAAVAEYVKAQRADGKSSFIVLGGTL
jgi:predicted extracellular nuclease